MRTSKADSEAATRDLYAAYKVWCEDNAENPLSPKSFSGFIAQNADAYQLEATNNVYIGSGKRCRGYLVKDRLSAKRLHGSANHQRV